MSSTYGGYSATESYGVHAPNLFEIEGGVGPIVPMSAIPADRNVALFSAGVMGLALYCTTRQRGSTMLRTLKDGKFEFYLCSSLVIVTFNYFYNASRLRTTRVARNEERIRARYIGPVAREQPYYDLAKLQAYIDGNFHPKKNLEQI